MFFKYNLEISEDTLKKDVHRLINQVYKLIPMRENEEDWNKQLGSVIIEVAGLCSLTYQEENIFILLTKLEGLREVETDFPSYRKTVFEAISLLKGVIAC